MKEKSFRESTKENGLIQILLSNNKTRQNQISSSMSSSGKSPISRAFGLTKIP